ncbi:MAG: SdrD B-like domain-containing protein [Verrucomicrobiota bacterium]
MKNRNFHFLVFAFGILSQSLISVLPAQGTLRATLNASRAEADVSNSQSWEYRVRYNASSTTHNARNASLRLRLPVGVDAFSVVDSSHVASSNINASGGRETVNIQFVDPLPAGSTGDIVVTAKFEVDVETGFEARTRAEVSSSNFNTLNSSEVSVLATNGQSPVTIENGVYSNKSGPSSVQSSSEIDYWIRHGTKGKAQENYMVEDTLPAGMKIDFFDTGKFRRGNVAVDVYYRTNSNNSWRSWPGNPNVRSNSSKRLWPSALGLSSGDYLRGIQLRYGDVTGGIDFHYQSSGRSSVRIRALMVDPYGVAEGTVVTNTAHTTSAGASDSDSVSTTIRSDFGSVTFEDDISVSVWDQEDEVAAPMRLIYGVKHGFNGPQGTSAPDYVLENLAPAGTYFDYIRTGRFAGASGSVQVQFRTNQNASWRTHSSVSVSSNVTLNRWDFPLAANERINGFRLVYGTLQGGGLFHPERNGRSNTNFGLRLENWQTVLPGTTVTNCVTASATGFNDDQDCEETSITNGEADYSLWEADQSGAGSKAQGEEVTFRITFGSDPENTVPQSNIRLAALLPPELTYLGNENIRGDNFQVPDPEITVEHDYLGTGKTLVVWDFSSTGLEIYPTADWNHAHVSFDTQVSYDAGNGQVRMEYFGSWTPEGEGYSNWVVDSLDVDQDGNVTDLVAADTRTLTVQTDQATGSLDATLFVRGQLDSDWTRYPQIGETVPGGEANYQLKILNSGNVGMTEVTIIDVLPAIGDRGVVDNSARGSEWSPFLVGEVSAPDGVQVYYSTEANPQRDELTPGLPADAAAANWSSTPPNDITQVRSLKFDFGSYVLEPGEELTLEWPMRVPGRAPDNGEVAWNSFGFVGMRTDTREFLLASEPIKTGISVVSSTGGVYGDFVWLDENEDGIQNAERGINGILVELYEAVNGTPDPANDPLFSFTVTTFDGYNDGGYVFGGLPLGKSYYAVIYPPNGYLPSPSDRTDDNLDSDGTEIAIDGRRALYLPVKAFTSAGEDRSFDLGLFDIGTAPSVWAIVEDGNGKIYLGGDFTSSHGVPRGKIARVMEDGSLDVTFNPGTGFDGTVHAIHLLGDGSILVGGAFSQFNGAQVNGLAHLDEEGNLVTGSVIAPDSGIVYWIGNAPGGGILYAGDFEYVQGHASRGVARLTPEGSLDRDFVIEGGASDNGVVYAAGTMPDGRMLFGGSFDTFAGVAVENLVCVKPDGSIDESFAADGINGAVQSIKVYPWGEILISGTFENVDGSSAQGVALLNPDGSNKQQINNTQLDVEEIRRSH